MAQNIYYKIFRKNILKVVHIMATRYPIPLSQHCIVAKLPDQTTDVLSACVTDPALVYVRVDIDRHLRLMVLAEWTMK